VEPILKKKKGYHGKDLQKKKLLSLECISKHKLFPIVVTDTGQDKK